MTSKSICCYYWLISLVLFIYTSEILIEVLVADKFSTFKPLISIDITEAKMEAELVLL